MATGTVRVKGLRETRRAFRKLSKDLDKEVRDGLREAAKPVHEEASNLFARYDADSAGGYRIRVRQRGVAVEQSKRRTTGLRPDYGKLQMRRALIPALDRRQDEVIEGIDKVLDRLAGENGF